MPNLPKVPPILFFILWNLSTYGQDLQRCGSTPPSILTDPSPKEILNSYPRSTIYIPVVFHIVYSSEDENIPDETIWSQLDVLNSDYNALNEDLKGVPARFEKNIGSANIRFCLATTDPDGQEANGIVRVGTTIRAIGGKVNGDGDRLIKHDNLGGSDSWDVSRYLNIWVGDRDDFLGDATFPFDEEIPTDEEGVVIKYSAFGVLPSPAGPFNRGRTLTHEIGHYFNVFHLFGSETGCHNDDDLVADTPRQSGPYFGCEDAETLSSCGSHDMASNFMNFRDDNCMNFFTKGQTVRMIDALFTYRYELVNSRICNSNPVLPPDPLRVAKIITLDRGIELSLTPLVNMKYHLDLFSLDGRRIWESSENLSGRFEINGFPMGIYVLSLEFDGQTFSRKVFIP